MALYPECAERGVVWPARGHPLQGTTRKERLMRPHHMYSITPSNTPRYINDHIDNAVNNTLTCHPPCRATRFPTARWALTLGLGAAILVMLGTWLSLSTRATAGITTFVAHPEDPTLSADAPAEMGISPFFFEDIFTHF